ncbi:MAG: hypothetical protein RIS83_519 [Pseudomonadota bacterium]
MRKAILLLAGLSAVALLTLWLRDLGGIVEIRVGETWIGVSMPIAVGLIAAGFILLHGALRLIAWARALPARVKARRDERRRAEGDGAITRALVALGAGTAEAARAETRRARALLGDTPQTLLLAAQAERVAGREDAAASIFQSLVDHPQGRFLGLRGLLRQAMQREDWPEAKRLAREAEAAQPGAAWLREERRLLAERTQDWREALALCPPDGPRAALALAAAAQEEDAARAAELEKRAVAADAKFAPAAIAHAARLEAAGSHRRARGVLEAAWLAAPHPDIGAAWVASVAAPLARVKAVEDLTHRNANHPEARLLMARIALEAGLTGRARSELDALVGSGAADRRAYLLLATLEETEQGDTAEGRAAQTRWLREAAAAADAPRWRCDACGAEHGAWKPDCAACGATARINWSSPASLPALTQA